MRLRRPESHQLPRTGHEQRFKWCRPCVWIPLWGIILCHVATWRIHHLVILFHLWGTEQLQQAKTKLTLEKQSPSQLRWGSILPWGLKHMHSQLSLLTNTSVGHPEPAQACLKHHRLGSDSLALEMLNLSWSVTTSSRRCVYFST